MMKKSMDDPIKQRWREREYKFIKKHAGQLGNPKEWRIAFLPGGDAGLVPTELEMFERFGIRRSNVVGVEQNNAVHNKLKARKLGINLELANTEDFFDRANSKFDIISLDFSGQFTEGASNTIRNIAQRQVLKEKSILTTNFYGRMEESNTKFLYYLGALTSDIYKIFSSDEMKRKLSDIKDSSDPKDKLIKIASFAKEIGCGKNIQDLRNIGIRHEIMKILLCGKSLASERKKQDLEKYLEEKGYHPLMSIFPLVHRDRPYVITDNESYWYRSENGSPMYSDFFYLDQHIKFLERYIEFANKVIDGNLEDVSLARKNALIDNDIFNTDQWVRDFFNVELLLNRALLVAGKRGRVFLGSSSKRPKLDGRTYYKLKMESAESGQDRKDLWEQLKDKYKTSNGQLRAFERHFNMETYGPTNIEKPVKRGTPRTRPYAVTEMFNSDHPYGFLERLPKETKMRLEYFLGEDLPLKINLNATEKDELVKNIAGSKWYKIAEKGGATEQQIRTFFDDVMLYCIWNEKVPNKDKINELLYNSLNGGHILPERLPESYVAEVKRGGEDMSPRGSPRISKDAAVVLLKLGHDPLEISNVYSGHTPQQLRALKACNTMGKYNNLELDGELASELFGVCGLNTTDVRKAFPYLSAKKIGAYKAWDTMRGEK